MGRFMMFVMGIAVVAAALYFAMQPKPSPHREEASAPKRQLDNVREAAGRVELELQKKAEDVGSEKH